MVEIMDVIINIIIYKWLSMPFDTKIKNKPKQIRYSVFDMICYFGVFINKY